MPGGSPTSIIDIVSLTTGPDGNVWFAADVFPAGSGNQVVIGDVTPGGQVTEFPPIPIPAGQAAGATEIVSGPGGDLWFDYTVFGPKLQVLIGQVTTAGASTLFPVSSFSPKASILNSLAAGADGDLWFTDGSGKNFAFGRMSPSGVVTEFPIDKLVAGHVASGPNGALIVTGQNAKGQNEVFSVSTSGAVTRDKIPTAISNDFSNDLGSADGSLWFTSLTGAGKVGQITATGAAKSYSLFARGRRHDVSSMAVGQDGNPYLLVAGTVYRLSPSNLRPAC